jgi:hypothetical protein
VFVSARSREGSGGGCAGWASLESVPFSFLLVPPGATTRVLLPSNPQFWWLLGLLWRSDEVVVNETTSIEPTLILGFDARHYPWGMRESSPHWCPLRSDIDTVASVDDEVWPSVCFSGGPIKERPWVGFVQFLWRDLNKLKTYLEEEHTRILERYWTIAVTLSTDTCHEPEKLLWKSVVLHACPRKLSSTWSFLGYDVADRFLFSALTNSVHHKHKDYEEIKAAFLNGINSYHLLRNTELAICFREVANRRSPEHKPFFVFGVWRI